VWGETCSSHEAKARYKKEVAKRGGNKCFTSKYFSLPSERVNAEGIRKKGKERFDDQHKSENANFLKEGKTEER